MPDETVLEAPKPTDPLADEARAPRSEDAPARSATDAATSLAEGPQPDAPVADATGPDPGDTAKAAAPGVRFKGWRGGLLIQLPEDGEWAEVSAALAERMAAAKDFWEGAPATIALASREIAQADLEDLVGRLREDFGLEPSGVVSAVESVRQAALALELEVYEDLPQAQPKPERPDPRDQTRYIKGTVRSGVVAESPGNLVVVGDVNAGAEIRAAGDIVVMGTLRGVAHAGFGGDLTAQILAINLRPTQLRIGDLIARSPDGGQPPLSKFPEKAVVEQGEIHVLPL